MAKIYDVTFERETVNLKDSNGNVATFVKVNDFESLDRAKDLMTRGQKACQEKEYAKAVELLREAAELGYAPAQELLGIASTCSATTIPSTPNPSAEQLRPTIRMATFQLGRLDEAKLANLRVSDVLIRLLPRFDLIALQGVRGKNQGVLLRLVEQMGATSGRTYDFATCPTQQHDALEHYSAFVFDKGRIEVDRTTVHFVEDRLGRIRIKPLVGSFRVHGPDPTEAFTFTLINVETDPDHAAAELDLLVEVFRAVRDDGRNEDDIILLGDLKSDGQHLGQLGKMLGVTALVSGVPSITRGTNLLDNILLDRRATSEFTGRVEVVDMIREFNLIMSGAQEISAHLPVWAEFSAYEGGQVGHTANAL